MSSPAIETFSTFGVGILCVVLGIIALAIFFTALRWLGSRGAKPETMAVRGVLKKETWATVHMSGAETFERVRFIGFTNTESIKTHIPYDLNGMVILEDREGRRFLVRAKAIRMIVIAPAVDSGWEQKCLVRYSVGRGALLQALNLEGGKRCQERVRNLLRNSEFVSRGVETRSRPPPPFLLQWVMEPGMARSSRLNSFCPVGRATLFLIGS